MAQNSNIPQVMRNVFGIIMIVIYVTMGILCLTGVIYFGNWTWLRWVGGIVFIAYGIWRAYRQFKGIDPDITTRE